MHYRKMDIIYYYYLITLCKLKYISKKKTCNYTIKKLKKQDKRMMMEPNYEDPISTSFFGFRIGC